MSSVCCLSNVKLIIFMYAKVINRSSAIFRYYLSNPTNVFLALFFLQILSRFVTFLDFEFSSTFSKISFSQQSYYPIRLKFGNKVCSLSRHMMPQTVLRMFLFLKFFWQIWSLKKYHISYRFSKSPFSQRSYCPIQPNFGMHVCLLSEDEYRKRFWEISLFKSFMACLDWKKFIFSNFSNISSSQQSYCLI